MHLHDTESKYFLTFCTLGTWLSKTTENTYNLSQFQWAKNLRTGESDDFTSGSIIKLQSRCHLEYQSSEGFTRLGVMFLNCVTHTTGKLVMAVGRRPQFSPRRPLQRWLDLLRTWQLTSLKPEWVKRKKGGSHNVAPFRNDTSSFPPYSVNHADRSGYNIGEDYTKV